MNAWEAVYRQQHPDKHSRLAQLLILLFCVIEMWGLIVLGLDQHYAEAAAGFAAVLKETVRKRLMGE